MRAQNVPGQIQRVWLRYGEFLTSAQSRYLLDSFILSRSASKYV